MVIKVIIFGIFPIFLILPCLESTGVASDSNTFESTLKDGDDFLNNLQKGRTRRMIWLDKRRRLIFPPDTSLSITPILAFPLFKQSSTWMSFENLQIQWTFFILFQGLGWTSEDNAWPLDISLLIPNMTENNSDVQDPSRRVHFESCQKKGSVNRGSCARNSIPIMALPTSFPGGERALIFPRIEKFLDSVGIHGRACLQRAVCEVHEIPLKNGFGLLGEFLTMFFSVGHSTYAKSHLPSYLRAERAGKLGDCTVFHRRCPYSIFTSKK